MQALSSFEVISEIFSLTHAVEVKSEKAKQLYQEVATYKMEFGTHNFAHNFAPLNGAHQT
jgi:hypothetical protein